MGNAKKILVVEDEAVIALDLQNSLENFGYAVTENIPRGEDVIRSIKNNRPDVILMDIKLEGDMDGIETSQMIYEEYDIPIIFITSFSNKNIVERAKRSFPFGYIVKPFEDNELYTNIEIAYFKHQTEIKLRESERKYRELAESIQQIVLECDFSTKILYLNQTGMELLGISPKEITDGVYLEDLLLTGQFEKIVQRIKQSDGQKSTNREYKLINRKGKTLVIEEYLLPLVENDGIVGFRGVLIDITERKYFANKIKESEERFRQIANTVDVAFWIVSVKDNVLQFVNPAFMKIYELKNPDTKFSVTDIRNVIYADDLQFVKSEYEKKVFLGTFDVHYRILTKNGRVKWLHERAVPIRNNKGIIVRVAGYSADVTDKIEAELELSRSEKIKESILKSMPDSFMKVDKNGTVIHSYIKKNEHLLGKKLADDLTGSNIRKIFPPSISGVLLKGIEDCVKKSGVVISELSVSKRGKNNWFEVRITQGNDDDILLIIRNVTEEKQNILELQKYFNITEQTKELILITDNKGNIEYVNPMFTEVTGYKLSDVIGNKPSFFKTKKHPESFYNTLWNTILSGKSFKSEFINLKKNGEEYIEEKIITPIKNTKGEIINFISTGRDITLDRRRERKIRAYQKFEKILEKKEQKYRTLSIIQGEENERKRVAREIHDGLGQMLTVAMANLNTVNLHKLKCKEEIEKINLSKQVMSEIIQESRRISHNLSPGGLYEFGLHAILKQFVDRINQNYKGLKIDFISNIKDIRFKNEIEINLYRIIQEAVQNSMKHSKSKRIKLSIDFREKALHLLIKDNGIGMNLKRIEEGTKHFNGIRNIQERAKVIDANLKLVSQVNKGVEISINLKAKQITK